MGALSWRILQNDQLETRPSAVLYATTHKVAGNPTRANSFTPRSSVLFGALSWIEVPQVVSDGRISYRPLLVRTFAKQLCGVRRVRPECNAWILAMAGSLRLEYQGRPFIIPTTHN